ncbi:MAG TPA: hypothetical protein VKQ06_05610 [Gammaproteobacteria bacterium]|nr:hypothetical protein [Gammaproteobacteria bacterium]
MNAILRRQIKLAAAALLGIAACCAVLAQQVERSAAPLAAEAAVRFASIDVVIDAPEPLAAWQFELSDGNGSMLIVGIENGDSAAFADAPYFDLDAVQAGRAERIVVADFNASPGADLPQGTTRIATVHVRYDAQTSPDYQLRLMAAGNAAGEPIDAAIELATR